MGAALDNDTSRILQELDKQSVRVRVADALPYQYIGQVGKMDMVHLLDDQSFGIGFHLGVPSVESLPGSEAHISGVIDQIIRKLPAGYVAQWYRRNTTDVSEYLELYKRQTSEDPIAQTLCAAGVDRWERAIPQGFFPGTELNFFPCREEMALMIKSPPSKGWKPAPDQVWAMLTGMIDAPSPRYKRLAKSFENVIRDIREAATSGGMGIAPMGGEAFVPFVVTLLYPNGNPRQKIPAYSQVESVSEAISAAGFVDLLDEAGNVRTDGFVGIRDGKPSCHRVVSMIWQPSAVEPGLFNDIVYKEPNVSVVTTVEMLPQLFEGLKIKTQQFLSSRSTTTLNATEMGEKQKSFTAVTTRLFQGEKICRVRMQAIVSADTEEKAENAAVRVQSFMESKETSSVVEETFGSSLILPGSLPFTFEAKRETSFQRSRRMLSRDIAEMMPAGGRWCGVVPNEKYLAVESNRRKPIVMYANSVGAPLFINPHECEENPHMLVAGGSGSGKSFFIHDLILQMWRIPAMRVYLISIKADYMRLSHVLGRYIDIDLDEPISLNPFGGKPTLKNQAVWSAALVLMITEGDEREHVNKEQKVVLEQCAMIAARENWDEGRDQPRRETLLQDIVVKLLESGEIGRQLAHKLTPYYKGPYSNLINAPRTLTKGDKFVFFNLAKVRKMTCLPVLMFCLFRFIDEIMYDPLMVAIPKVLGLDEGWAGMNDPYSAALFTESFRAYRSLGGQAFAISQRFGDFDSPLGQAILANTATKIVLPQAESELSDLRRYIRLNDREFAAVSRLRLHKRFYGEFFVKMQGHYSTTGRVIPDALKYAISTTDGGDEAIHQQLLEEVGGDYFASIANFANRYPFGNPVVH